MATVGIGLFQTGPSTTYGALARRTEELGYARIWISDQRFWRDFSVTLTQAVLATEKISIGSAVTDPYIRHPALTAGLMGTLDELSGGRMALGMGSGLSGFSALGIKRDKPVLAMKEAMELMRRLWAGGMVDYAGETTSFRHSMLEFPAPRPRIPMYIAGRGPQVLKLAGRSAEGVLIGSLASPPLLQYSFRHIDAGLKATGRDRKDIDVAIWLHTAISPDGAAAREAVRTVVTRLLLSSLPVLGEWGIDIPAPIKETLTRVVDSPDSRELAQVRSMITDDILRHFCVMGTPAECRAQVQELVAGGINHIAIVPWLVPGQSLEQFATIFAEGVGTTF